MRLTSKILIALFILVAMVGGWAAYYAQDKGFTHRWRNFIQAEFEKRGMHATIRRLTLDPLHGLIAKDVLVYEDPDHTILLLSVSKIALDIDLARIFSSELSLRSMDIRGAKVTIPLDPARKLEGDKLRLENINAHIRMPEDQVEIVRAEAEIHDLQVIVTGSLNRPSRDSDDDDGKDDDDDDDDKFDQEEQLALIRSRRSQIDELIRHLDRTRFSADAKPVLEINVIGNVEKPEELRAIGKFKTGPFDYVAFSPESIEASFEYAQDLLTVKDLSIEDRYGKLSADLSFDTKARDLKFWIDSSVDLPSLVKSAVKIPALQEVAFYRPPHIEASGVYHAAKPFDLDNLPLDISGKFKADRITSRGAIFDALSLGFSAEAEKLYLREILLEHKSGFISADLLRTEEGMRFQSNMRMDPTVFAPFLVFEGSRQFLSQWTFTEESNVFVTIEGEGSNFDPESWVSKGLVDLRNCELNGHPIDHMQGEMYFEGHIHNYFNVEMSRPEGSVTGKHIQFDAKEQTCRLKDVKGKVYPVHAVGWFAPHVSPEVEVYEFQSPPELSMEGLLDCRDPEEFLTSTPRHDYILTFSCDSSADYPIFGRMTRFHKPTGTVHVRNDSLYLSDFSTESLGGKMTADLILNGIHTVPQFKVNLGVHGVDFQQFTKAFSTYESSSAGTFTGTGYFEWINDRPETVKGKGAATIYNGDVFSIPAFGPLSKPVKEILPKVHDGFSVAHEAGIKFEIEDNIFKTTDFQAMTNTFKLKGDGQVNMVSGEMDMEIGLNLRGPAGAVFSPVSKLLEFKGEGTIADSDWKVKNIPSIEGTIKEITHPLKRFKRDKGEGEDQSSEQPNQ